MLAFTGTGGASPASPATVYVRSSKARVLALRGDTVAARDALDGVLDHARAIGETQAAAPALATAALVEFLDGHQQAALRLIDEGLELRSLIYAPLAELGRILLSLQARDRVQKVIDRASPVPRSLHEAVSVRAMLAEADDHAEAKGLYEEAVSRWRGFGNPLELGYALAGLSRIQMRLGLATKARCSEREAQALFTNLRVAKPYKLSCCSGSDAQRSVAGDLDDMSASGGRHRV